MIFINTIRYRNMDKLLVFRQLTLNRKVFIPSLLQQQLSFSRCHRVCLQQRKADEFRENNTVQTAANTTRSELSTDVSLGEKIKENTKTASYTAIILAGIGVTGIMFYAIFRELFSSWSPNNIYSAALDRVKEDTRVQDTLGAPIKGFGEESRRRRRQHVAHQTYERNGMPHMRMQFYVQGLRNKATVHLEARKTPSGRIEYRYLFVQLEHFPRTTIIIEDNRALDSILDGQKQSSSFNSSNIDAVSYNEK